jgi:dTDP-4-dehydrorhamnose 3,5-epimerase
MKAIPTSIPGVLILEPAIFNDARGFFFESWNASLFSKVTNCGLSFVQDNQSNSKQGVLRGLHYQVEQPQGKLVRAVKGRIVDVAVDLRKSSPTFSNWVSTELSEYNCRQIWIPPGFAHGFFVLSDSANVLYKTTDYYAPSAERCIIWNDPDIAIEWPAGIEPVLSAKDRMGLRLRDSETF